VEGDNSVNDSLFSLLSHARRNENGRAGSERGDSTNQASFSNLDDPRGSGSSADFHESFSSSLSTLLADPFDLIDILPSGVFSAPSNTRISSQDPSDDTGDGDRLQDSVRSLVDVLDEALSVTAEDDGGVDPSSVNRSDAGASVRSNQNRDSQSRPPRQSRQSERSERLRRRGSDDGSSPPEEGFPQ